MSFSHKRIRALALCVFRRRGKILLFQGYDAVKREAFYRPIGGSVEFGETAKAAAAREVKEELSARVRNLVLLGVSENIFTYRGRPGHEVVFVFDGRFMDKRLYRKPMLRGRAEKQSYEARWVSLAAIQKGRIPLYPTGLLGLLSNQRKART